MTDQIQNPNIEASPQTPAITPVATPQPSATNLQPLLLKPKLLLVNVFNKFYSNKKIFWPVSIAIGLILLIIILGLIFGKRRVNQSVSIPPSPTPAIQNTPEASTSGDVLIDSRYKLNDLRNQINKLDVKQSHFQPPNLDFDIKF